MPSHDRHAPANRRRVRRARSRTRSRGATIVEYALLLFLVLVVAAFSVKLLGNTTRQGVDHATMQFY
jgi:Flp pilus assembly protein TadG